MLTNKNDILYELENVIIQQMKEEKDQYGDIPADLKRANRRE